MENNNQKRSIGNLFYGIIGIATLILATIGATFAYYTATQTDEDSIDGNMATINFNLSVNKVTQADDTHGGMIPMSNNMMEQALSSTKGICIDNNGNAVCQVYKIIVENTSSASMFLDGYVTLKGGSGVPEDVETVDDTTTSGTNEREWENVAANSETTMRWAQAFCSEESGNVVTKCTTKGASTVRASSTISISALGGTTTQGQGFNRAEIKLTTDKADTMGAVTGTATINNNTYQVINSNYIRISDHTLNSTTYSRDTDITSALVFNQFLNANDLDATNNDGNSSNSNATGADKSYKDAQVYYIVVWLSETGTNQTKGATGASTKADGFYQGNVTFISAQGSEVTATFAGQTRVKATS